MTRDSKALYFVALFLIISASFVVLAPSSHAAFPGPNGRIAYARDDGDAGWVYTSNPDGSGDAPLAIGQWPRWSPDGAKIVYLCRDPFGTCIMNADGSGQHRFPTPQGTDIWASWSADGTRLVFTHGGDDTGGDPEIFTANADGTDRQRLTTAAGYDLHATWSPDGSTIAFVRDGSLWVMNPDGSGQRSLTIQTGDYAPDWSADGTTVAFQRSDGEIYTIRRDGTGLQRLTNNQFVDEQPAWSPDGTQIMFLSLRGSYLSNDRELYVMNTDGSGQTRVTFNDVEELNPHWGTSTFVPAIPNTSITAGPSGWVRLPTASFSFAATIEGSTFECSLDGGAFSTCTSPVTYSNLSDGFHKFRVRATSPQGVGDPTPASRSWSVDATSPTISFLSRSQPNGAGWNSGNVIVEWQCADGGSGVVSHTTSVTLTSEGANQSATGTCTDYAGNSASDTQSGINIDKSPPVMALLSRTPANGDGWNNTPVTVEWSCSDVLSGPVKSTVFVTLSNAGRDQLARTSCTDLAGNIEYAEIRGINIDLNGPTTTIINSRPVPLVVGPIGAITGTASDDFSGIAATQVTFVSALGGTRTLQATCDIRCGTTSATWRVSTAGLAPGNYRVTASSTDLAGNHGPESLPVTLLIL